MIETGKFASILDSSLVVDQRTDAARSPAVDSPPESAQEGRSGTAGSIFGDRPMARHLPKRSIWSGLWPRFRDKHASVSPYHQVALKLNHSLSLPGASSSALLVAPRSPQTANDAALELSICLADELRRTVLLVDACAAGEGPSKLLHCADEPGYFDLLANEKPVSSFVQATNYPNLSFLPAGAFRDVSRNALPAAVEGLLQKIMIGYETVLIAGGPVLADPQTLVLAAFTGVVLLFAEGNETLMDDLGAAQDALNFCKTRDLGVVLVS